MTAIVSFQIDALARSATKISEPDTKAMEWTSHPNKYCSKDGSVPVKEDSVGGNQGGVWTPRQQAARNADLEQQLEEQHLPAAQKSESDSIQDTPDILGFDLNPLQCRQMCEESVECNVYSHGEWTKGWAPKWYTLWFGYKGKMRCQLYSFCKFAEIEVMSVFEKPSAATPTTPPETSDDVSTADYIVIAAVVVLIILSALVVLQSHRLGRQGGIACSFFATIVSAWLVSEAASKASWDSQNRRFCGLAVVHALNSVVLLCVALTPRRRVAFPNDPPLPPTETQEVSTPQGATKAEPTNEILETCCSHEAKSLTVERAGNIQELMQGFMDKNGWHKDFVETWNMEVQDKNGKVLDHAARAPEEDVIWVSRVSGGWAEDAYPITLVFTKK